MLFCSQNQVALLGVPHCTKNLFFQVQELSISRSSEFVTMMNSEIGL
jgi:hypothetical protein